jgi:hypothetical protein
MHMTQIASPQHEVKPPLERWRHAIQVAAHGSTATEPLCRTSQPT